MYVCVTFSSPPSIHFEPDFVYSTPQGAYTLPARGMLLSGEACIRSRKGHIMRHRTGILPRDFKNFSRSKMNSEDLKELARTILATIVLMAIVFLGLLLAATAPEPDAQERPTLKGGGQLVSSHPVAARRQSNP